MEDATVCYACGARSEATDQRCSCGEPLWYDLDPQVDDWPDGDEQSMWRFAEFLPVSDPSDLAAAAGGTPLVRTSRLDDYGGCRLSVKHEGANPTGSFKDRGSAVAVTAARERGVEWVGTVSHGNMAMSMAAHAAGCGLECLTLVPDDISDARVRAIGQFGPTLRRVDGDYGRLYYDTVERSSPETVSFTNSDSPLRTAGQKTTALEICEAFAPDVPDAIALPVSSGGHASATWKGLRELRDAGLIDAMPRLFWVQAAVCDPIAQAYREGASTVSRVESAETVAYSIGNNDPPSGTRALTAARETDGAVVSVTEDEILDATAALSTKAGLCVEPSSAVPLAGVRKLAREGDVAPTDDVVCVATGTGFKELDYHETSADVATIELDDLDRVLSELP
ncbi:threonine synthase [Haloarculaceae archaeon H-GB2-1]|nr:threonine synthase [Haloarculaceae archaeon H-GB1-1]MEA5409372.1 threonine synthase [Haloarculaceae archaeon H-GB2-1]